ncbi:MAG: HupE/UreJ family protein [bacterium]
MKRAHCGWLLAFFCLLSLRATAHTLKLSDSELNLDGARSTWNLKVHTQDFMVKFGRVNAEALRAYLPERLGVTVSGVACRFQDLRTLQDEAQEATTLQLSLSCPTSPGPVAIHYDLFYGDPSHRHLMKLKAFGRTYSFTFSPAQRDAQFGEGGLGETIRNFLQLGLEHILIGFDHILFVLALIFGAKRFRDLLWLVTSFTLAHSLSLALATLGIVSLPPTVVEPAIAASIVFLAVMDLLASGPRTPRGMLLLTFGFGLIHGLGFSYVLQEANLQAGNLAVPLVFFNLGVEIGQLLIVALGYPLTLGLARLLRQNYRYLKRASLALIAATGLYWLVERLFFG